MFEGDVDLKCVNQDEVFIDRDHETFNYLINYLRNDSKKLPDDITKNTKTQILNELAFWNIIDKYEFEQLNLVESLTQQQIQINKLLKSAPKINQEKFKTPYETWRKLGPLTIEEIFKNAN